MNIAGIQKLTLLDYPEKTACTIFTVGCNFRCPFCHNAELAVGEEQANVSEKEVLDYLISRRGKLDGLCITGGEPLLQTDILDFMAKVRSAGFLVKLDTNGSLYEKLKVIVDEKLCDYIAMDIKNVPEKYSVSAGCLVDNENVLKSIELLKNGGVDYEFRTTVVKELNDKSDFEEIAKLLSGAKRYYLQKFRDSERVMERGFSAYSDEEMHEIQNIVKANGLEVSALRGVD